MNRLHHWLCRSGRWERIIKERVSWALSSVNLGPKVLELGPGPGLTTDLLRKIAPQLTTIEMDPGLADALGSRLDGENVAVIAGDATAMPFADAQFSGAVSFTMLHHVPSAALQDQLLREVWRVLQPGGLFVGSDSLRNWFMRIIHIGDTFVPVDPDSFGIRLQAAGFQVLNVERNSDAFRFYARRPA